MSTSSIPNTTFAVKDQVPRNNGPPDYYNSKNVFPTDYNSRNQFQRKDSPFCTRCEISDHTIDTCYKIHGHPPCYKAKPRHKFNGSSSINTQVLAHEVSNTDNTDFIFDGNLLPTFTPNQYQELENKFAAHLSNYTTDNSSSDVALAAFSIGT